MEAFTSINRLGRRNSISGEERINKVKTNKDGV